MAFISRSGSRFVVRQGNNFRTLKTFSSRSKAQDYVNFLHAKNDPRRSNRGGNARKDFRQHKKQN